MQEKSKQEEQKSTKKIQKQKSSNQTPSPLTIDQKFKRKLSHHYYKKNKCEDDEKSYFVSFSGELHMQEETYDLHEMNLQNKKIVQLTFDFHNLNIQEQNQELDENHHVQEYGQYEDDCCNNVIIGQTQDGYN